MSEEKVLHIGSKYKATKTTCGYIAKNFDEISHLEFFDPKDDMVHPVWVNRYWFECQRSNRVVWLLDEEEVITGLK